MPLEVLLVLVGAGIAGIALMLHLTGHSRRFRFDSDAVARAEWLRHWPGDRIDRTLLAANQRAALIRSAQGIGVVWAFGADTTARLLARATATQDSRGLILHLPDFTAPRIRLELTSDEARLWADEIRKGTP